MFFSVEGTNSAEVFWKKLSQKTKTIVLEGAIFDPVLIRKTAKYLNHQTDASYRYERGVDPDGGKAAFDLAAKLILETCPEAKFGELHDKNNINNNEKNIDFNDSKINRLLGTDINHEDIVKSLERLYFKVEGSSVSVPSFRIYDITIWQDLAEEIGRVYGTNNISRKELKLSDKAIDNHDWLNREAIKEIFVQNGFSEIFTYSFADKNKIGLIDVKLDDLQEIINPISPETQFLRPDLKLSLLDAVSKSPWAPEINIFEIGKVFVGQTEKWQLGVATTDKNFDKLKKILVDIGTTAEIINIDQSVLDRFKIRRPINMVLVDIDEIKTIPPAQMSYDVSQNKYKPISKYPPTIRDLSFIIDVSTTSETLEKSISESFSGVFLTEVFDEFESPKFGQGKKNIALHLWFQNLNSNVNEDTVKSNISNIISHVEKTFNAKLRG